MSRGDVPLGRRRLLKAEIQLIHSQDTFQSELISCISVSSVQRSSVCSTVVLVRARELKEKITTFCVLQQSAFLTGCSQLAIHVRHSNSNSDTYALLGRQSDVHAISKLCHLGLLEITANSDSNHTLLLQWRMCTIRDLFCAVNYD